MKEIVVGSSVDALRHAFKHRCTLFLDGPPPFVFSESREEWDKLYAWLSLNSLVPFGDVGTGIFLDVESKILEAKTRGMKREFPYDSVSLYSDSDIGGLEAYLSSPCQDRDVYDIFHIKNVQPSTLVDVSREGPFMKDLKTFSLHRETFYCSHSEMTEEQVRDVEYSEPIARLSLFSILSDNGVLGSKNGKCKKTGKTKRLSIKLDHRERRVVRARMNSYSDIDGVSFCTSFNKLTKEEYNILDEPLKPFSGNNPYLQKRNVL